MADTKGSVLTAVTDLAENDQVIAVDDSAGTTKIVEAISLLRKNAIINGNFDVWQRGTSFASVSTGDFFADRWSIGFNGSGTDIDVDRQSFAVGQTDVPNEPEFYVRTTTVTAGSGQTRIDYRSWCEDVRTFAGQDITYSFWAKASTAKTFYLYWQQNFGSGGSTTVSTYFNQISVTTSWQKFTLSGTVPSISGKTLGAGNYGGFLMRDISPATGETFDLAQVQIEQGSAATPFERMPIGQTLALCKRYYEKSYQLADAPATVSNLGRHLSFAHNTYTLQQTMIEFHVRKRSTPTVTLYSNVTGASGKTYDNTAAGDVTAQAAGGSLSEHSFEINAAAVFVAGNYYTLHWTADAEL